MKILIPLTVLVLSFIIYYFFNVPQKNIAKENIPLESKNLSHKTAIKEVENNYIPSLATIKTKPETKSHVSQRSLTLDDLKTEKNIQASPTKTEKEYLTLGDLRKNSHQKKPHEKSYRKKVTEKKSQRMSHKPIRETHLVSPNKAAVTKALEDLKKELYTKKSHTATSLPIRETLPISPKELLSTKVKEIEKIAPKIEAKKVLPIIEKETSPKRSIAISKAVVSKKYDQEIFIRLKRRLKQSAPEYSAKKIITLNSPISSILATQHNKIKFKAFLYADFGLENETIDKQFKKNHTVLDWAMFLSR